MRTDHLPTWIHPVRFTLQSAPASRSGARPLRSSRAQNTWGALKKTSLTDEAALSSQTTDSPDRCCCSSTSREAPIFLTKAYDSRGKPHQGRWPGLGRPRGGSRSTSSRSTSPCTSSHRLIIRSRIGQSTTSPGNPDVRRVVPPGVPNQHRPARRRHRRGCERSMAGPSKTRGKSQPRGRLSSDAGWCLARRPG